MNEEIASTQMQKLKDTVFLICKIAQDNGLKLLSIHLSKIIFFADREIYLKTAQPMIVDRYIKGRFGPYLKELKTAIEDLKTDNYINFKQDFANGYRKETTEFFLGSKSDSYNITTLSYDEKEIITHLVIDSLQDSDPTSIAKSTYNHAWKVAQMKEKIPLSAQVLVYPAQITDTDIAWAESVLQ